MCALAHRAGPVRQDLPSGLHFGSVAPQIGAQAFYRAGSGLALHLEAFPQFRQTRVLIPGFSLGQFKRFLQTVNFA